MQVQAATAEDPSTGRVRGVQDGPKMVQAQALLPLTSSVPHSGGDGEEEEQMSLYEVRSRFMEELDENASRLCLEEAMDDCKKLSHPISKGVPLVVSALR